MRLLLDTNILISLTPRRLPTLNARIAGAIQAVENSCFASIASLWEIAIKMRLGKLDTGLPHAQFAGFLEAIGLTLLPIGRDHVLAEIEAEPDTRDPFDRLLLATCQVEGFRLVTLDRALRGHALAWK
jgi:PIN domain nuclease of toxin-antitoxin system